MKQIERKAYAVSCAMLWGLSTFLYVLVVLFIVQNEPLEMGGRFAVVGGFLGWCWLAMLPIHLCEGANGLAKILAENGSDD